jgi:hypothetical protein
MHPDHTTSQTGAPGAVIETVVINAYKTID